MSEIESTTPARALAALRPQPMAYVEDLTVPELTEVDRHHLQRSLRLRDGDRLGISDGRGRWRLARFGTELSDLGPIGRVPAPRVLLTIGFVPVKGERSETTVRRLTELGIDVMVPVLSRRSVVRWDAAKAAKMVDRHTRVAREAGMQSRRVWLPTLAQPQESVERFGQQFGAFALAEPGGDPIDDSVTTILIGPEGGFDAEEKAAGRPVGLPGGILRAETAVLASATLMAEARRFAT